FSGGDESRYAALVGRSRRFIRALKGQSDFRSIRKIIQNAYEKGAKKDRVCYSFHFWNPRGVELKIRSSWKTRRGTLGKPTPVKAEELNGPAFIFVNSVLTDSDLPKEVKKRAGGFEHNPAYFDDVPDISITKLFFQFDGTGVHLVDSMHELEMKAMEGIAPRRESRAVAQRTRVNYRV
ncbi:hypothetical protein HYR99_02255, partial [Candidatus Poribacteria bacterium]|nr:hypothetical protein [Candidatus Poribacteria bacterium]